MVDQRQSANTGAATRISPPSSPLMTLITDNDRVLSRFGADQPSGHIIWARQTILASGGAGQLYRESTIPKSPPPTATPWPGALERRSRTWRWVQFHPTTLYVAGSSRALITEAVRGEGAISRRSQRRSLHEGLSS